mmetsp:Transcript_23279/g.32154  ORF Transcript_23279/g.32154 Transcript_23279/m.32154 type:complete len:426 (+) Transcript_23279:42-1319(+)|eukprot:CAMPEP_0196579822 /NCGR_PEP_ID=MMETSP1081-20130531/24978_1 /TAXON_ID=36882 /ORGANISM="Pyramimonas amylifera, Strain CCMP720" /LENGTH=425 /DNA_ID=CAMNT_0041899517 /DNA_START=42 /DNA_END=1319 /DNA_ORIENTATION=+
MLSNTLKNNFFNVAVRASRTLVVPHLQQSRFLNVHEYQGAELLSKYGVNVPPGIAGSTTAEVKDACAKMVDSEGEVVLKSQILAGGRGLGTFKNGFQGGVHVVKVDQASDYISKMLGQTLVTKQSGVEGKPVNTLYVAKKLSLVNEMYVAILLDRASAGPVIIACSEGGTSIEDLAEEFPDRIIKVPIDINIGITDSQAEQVVEGLKVTTDKAAAMQQIKSLYDTFVKSDCTMLEVNPLAETADGVLVAADAKLNFDDNAFFRQKELFALRDTSQEDPREVEAAKADLNYIGLDGSIGCMVNGAGLAMATMDIIQLHGGSPANFLDVGGSATEEQVVKAFKLLLSDPKVKAILVNIFGGIMKCDVIASGVVAAAKQVGVTVPLIVRLEGTNVELGKQIIKDANMEGLLTADDLDDAAKKAVASIS